RLKFHLVAQTLGLDRVPCHQVHHLFHLTRASFRESRPVERNACLCPLRCPPEVRFEMTRIFKIGNVADSRKDRCGIEWTDWGYREQNLSFPAVLYDLGYFRVQSFRVLL